MPDTEAGEDAGLQSLRRPGSVMERTARGAGWVMFWRFSTRGLGLISTLILVHLLSPADFGIVALAMGFVRGLESMSELGTADAIIRADMPDRALYDTGFTINVLRGCGVAVAAAVLAYPAAVFFHNPHLAVVILFAAGVTLLASFQNIGIVDFRRFIAFEKQFKLKIIPRFLQIIIAITLGFLLRNYFALIVAILANQALTTFLSYSIHPYRPRFALSAWKRIASYSTFLWLTRIVGLVGGLGTKTVIGRFAGVGSVGVYEIANEIATLPASEVVAPLCHAAFSGFSEMRRDNDSGAGMLIRMTGLMAMLVFPAGIGLSLVAEPVVRLGFGAKWMAAVPMVEILGFASIFVTFGMIAGVVFNVQAWMKARLKVSLAVVGLELGLLLVLVPRFGLVGAALAAASGTLVNETILFVTTMRRLRISIMAVTRQIWRSTVACAVMTVVLVHMKLGWSVWSGPDAAMSLRLAEAVALGIAIYGGTIAVLWGLGGFPEGPERDLLSQMRRLWRRATATA